MARIFLTGDTTYYARADGNDANDGSANDAAHAWRTIPHAYDWIFANVDSAGYNAKIKVNSGTYSAGGNLFGQGVGGSYNSMCGISIEGDTTTPANVVISTTSNPCFSSTFGNLRVLGGFKLTSTSASAFYASGGGRIDILGPIEYGSCGQYHKHANMAGVIVDASSSYKISGGANAHVIAQKFSAIEANQPTITITNSPTFPLGFACAMTGYILHNSATFSGSLGAGTSPTYSLYYGGVVDTGGSNNLPGNSGPPSVQGYYI